MAVFGQIGNFDPQVEEWTEYAERLDLFMEANSVRAEAKKRAIFLASIGPSVYKLLRNLLAPDKPADVEYERLRETVKQHYNPKPSEIIQRFKFNSRTRNADESVSDFLAELRALAAYCNFGDSLNEMLRDRFVCGIENKSMQKKMLSESQLTLKRAVEIALSVETAEKDTHLLEGASHSQQIHKVKVDEGKQQQFWKLPCSRCGSSDHYRNQCKFGEAICHYCKKKGHLKRVCRARLRRVESSSGKVKAIQEKSSSASSSEGESEYHLYTVGNSGSSGKPLEVKLLLNNKPVVMEVDTGASRTIMSKSVFQSTFGSCNLRTSDVILKTYSGEVVKVIGSMEVEVLHNGKKQKLPLLIVDGAGPSLLGRNWLKNIKLDWHQLFNMAISKPSPLAKVLEDHQEVFEPELGKLKGYEAKLYIDEAAKPRFCRARPVPFSMKPLVSKELDKLLEQGVLKPVDFAEWAAPIVPVLKSDQQSVRICGDFKMTINPVTKLDRYPLPHTEDLLANLSGGTLFSKLDLTQAYQQITLDEESQKLVVINTHKGLFRFTRLPFGVSSAPGIFQRVMESILQGISGIAVFLDDILISGKSEAEHLATLKEVLSRLSKAGLRLQKHKCKFMVSEVQYLGYKIDAAGLHPLPEKVKAIHAAPAPTDVSQLKSYLGLISYYGKFIPNLSTMMAPLYKLLRKSVPWKWGALEQKAFADSKAELASSSVLAHFDPSLDLTLACDASSYGVGAVLAHRLPDGSERPIAFASRTLAEAEKKYSQIEKEGLACVFGVKRFHYYLFGRPFSLVTDHKPLLSLFSETKGIPMQASGRIQRWALLLSNYRYTVRYRTSSAHSNADALSRLPLKELPASIPTPAETVLLFDQLDSGPITSAKVRLESSRNPMLARVLQFVMSGWPHSCPDEEMKPYWYRRTELSCIHGCLLWGNRVVVPEPLRQAVIHQLHESHPGIVCMKSIGRMFAWWPQFDKDLENFVRKCPTCQSQQSLPPVAPLCPWVWPSNPWSRIHIDFAGPFQGCYIFIIVDAHSKWIEAYPMKTITSTATIEKLRVLFAQFGIPDMIVSDNGSNFTSDEFQKFCHRNGIKHITSAPYHPASNGLAERAVRTVKDGLRKIVNGSLTDRLSRYLLTYRITPHQTTGQSPSELMFGRRIRSALDLLKPDLHSRVENQQDRMKKNHDQRSKERVFKEGDPVLARNFGMGEKWIPGEVTAVTGPVSSQVRLEGSDRQWRRHVDHIRPRATSPVVEDPQAQVETEHLESTGPRRSSRQRRSPDRLTYS